MDDPKTQNPGDADNSTEPALEPGASDGDLPENLKPYSQVIPWDQIPEELHESCLTGIKKLHGAKTRVEQELSGLKKQTGNLQELQERSEFLKHVMEKPGFQDFYEGKQSQQTKQAGDDESLEALNEHGFDQDAVKALTKMLNSKQEEALKPLNQQVQQLQQQLLNNQMKDEFKSLESLAENKGYPSPDTKVDEIHKLMSSGRAGTVKDAYLLTIQDELPDIISAQLKTQMQNKAGKTVPPGTQTSKAPSLGSNFSGENAVWDALQSAKAELQKG